MPEQRAPLEEWLLEQPGSVFPGKGKYDYHGRLLAATNYFVTKVHPYVELGSLMQDGLFLTGHGSDHVQTVIRRAGELVGDFVGRPDRLTPYEAFLLIMAAHSHDAGLVLGRADHEKKAAEALAGLYGLFGNDMVEVRAFLDIARVHGGSVNGDKDTISRLTPSDFVYCEKVRYQYLAALLRLADELADDRERAAEVPLAMGLLPSASEVHHAYASHLHSVVVDHSQRAIRLHFDLTKAEAIRSFHKGQKKVLLLDEIFSRTLKLHRERMYCMRFLRESIRLDTVMVNVDVFLSPQQFGPPVERIPYRLEERGYPETGKQSVHDICPELTWTAKKLKAALRSRKETNVE